ncbi:GGDEF domain-containing protein [Clostridium beijerinckii]|nr:GGDEF domain-containing protein [Clostridium beijerinckii]
MNELYEIAENKLSLIKNMYDTIRVIDPINKNILSTKNNGMKKLAGKCYENFNKGTLCSNCISMRAYFEKDTFIKMEYFYNKVMLIIATPVTINEHMYVVEIIKDISSPNNKMLNINYENNVGNIIDNINEKIIRDDLTGVYNRIYIEEKLPFDVNNSIINKYLFSIIMIEIADFKSLNYEYGQGVQDKILKDFNEFITNSVIYDSYWIGRYSSDKFIIVLNNIDKEEACKISDKIRCLLEDTLFKYNDKIIKLNAKFAVYCSKNQIVDIKNILTELQENTPGEKQKGTEEEYNKDKKLSILNYKIQELRDVLNEMCISSDETEDYRETLKISQDLDELIVEYMKI